MTRPGSSPAWDGDLAALSDDELDHRIQSLGEHIGRLHTVWHWLDGWRPSTQTELLERELPRWIKSRVDALNERESRRLTEAVHS